jgi:arsenite methyltransferase
MNTESHTGVNSQELEDQVKAMYSRVAEEPQGEFHFEMGRALAERLGYDPAVLDRVPQPAIDSFAGVGHHFGLAALRAGERVVDLGSGSGMDSFVAAIAVGRTGRVDGVDMPDAQRNKATRLASTGGFDQIHFHAGRIEALPFADDAFDCVISNGVINLVADKQRVFDEAARVLKRGGRLALSDIVTSEHLPESVVCDVTLWASCIGGAMERNDYQKAISGAGFIVEVVQANPQYGFLPGRADRSARKFGVQSISLLARKA